MGYLILIFIIGSTVFGELVWSLVENLGSSRGCYSPKERSVTEFRFVSSRIPKLYFVQFSQRKIADYLLRSCNGLFCDCFKLKSAFSDTYLDQF